MKFDYYKGLVFRLMSLKKHREQWLNSPDSLERTEVLNVLREQVLKIYQDIDDFENHYMIIERE
jgi:hypothetical protein